MKHKQLHIGDFEPGAVTALNNLFGGTQNAFLHSKTFGLSTTDGVQQNAEVIKSLPIFILACSPKNMMQDATLLDKKKKQIVGE